MWPKLWKFCGKPVAHTLESCGPHLGNLWPKLWKICGPHFEGFMAQKLATQTLVFVVKSACFSAGYGRVIGKLWACYRRGFRQIT
ncbi:hypothetical protein C9439_03725 [archaeon SCG-AAA382B04]|nr:hypothetical protein C9439_03725 [archaeon SCG-AAA382B04]